MSLTNQLVIAEREEVARGIRALLATPLIGERGSPETFDLIRRRREPIRQWFDYYCGWTLTVEPRLGYARLVKVRAAADPTRPARRLRSGRAAFDRRRYVLLCVVAAELLTVPVTTIGLLAGRVAQASAADDLVTTFDVATRAERLAFVDVLKLLESFGVLEAADGDPESFVDDPAAKVLFRVDATLLLRLLAAPVGPSQLAVPADDVALRFEELLEAVSHEQRYGLSSGRHEDTPSASDVQRNLWLRHTVFRRLVDDPVLYFAELTAEERAYLGTPTGRQLLRRAAEQGGFVLEERAEGVLLVDVDGLATDERFPDDGSNAKVAALLLLDALDEPRTIDYLQKATAKLLKRFPRWAKTYRGRDGVRRLTVDALAVLTGFGLVRTEAELVRPLPAAARYTDRTEEAP
ncbi:TIGR02678 family protein [Amycolatopsis keratiniphila]|uniref:TIGR02678 family protein n=1 Tax=Amycolatopsis keratiniphila TaxID=129921 RepID=UPI00087BD064|nr:TIGR02678 family protein [Amycolatopsis keratiniphila]OLZ51911.1 TIGR02678 family protein [Amycolatopsis keratiniphila subsp. nogabecina]SDU62078.1 TIGR02678 family protein [Amycolatopsis keratiniphila]